MKRPAPVRVKYWPPAWYELALRKEEKMSNFECTKCRATYARYEELTEHMHWCQPNERNFTIDTRGSSVTFSASCGKCKKSWSANNQKDYDLKTIEHDVNCQPDSGERGMDVE